MLRQLRESAGISAELVASAMKVSPQKLDALENDRLGELPNMTFARALAAAICRAFGVDPAPVLACMPEVTAPDLVRASEVQKNSQRLKRSGDQPASMMSGRPFKLLLALIVVALAIAAALRLLPIRLGTQPGAATPAEAVHEHEGGDANVAVTEPVPVEMPASTDAAGQESAVPVPAPAQPASAAPAAFDRQKGAAPAASAPAKPASAAPAASAPAKRASATPAASAPAKRASATPAASAPAKRASATPAASAPAPASSAVRSADDLLGIAVSGETWVSVRDASGKALVARVMTAGQVVRVGGELPLTVIIGRKDATDVSVRGKPFDIRAFGGASNVARFTVD